MFDHKVLLSDVRAFLKEKKIDVLIVNSTDEYLNEYVELNRNSRYLLTGFTGSTGDAIVTGKDVFLFVDGRYHHQADEEVDHKMISVVKVGLDKSPKCALFEKIIELSTDQHLNVGLIASKVSCSDYRKFLELLAGNDDIDIELMDYDPVEKLANVKTEPKESLKLTILPLEIAGLSPQQKLDYLLKSNRDLNYDYIVIAKLEEISYLTNLRSNQIPFSSSFRAKAMVNREKAFLFTDLAQITPEITSRLGENFVIKEENSFYDFLSRIKNGMTLTIAYSSGSTNVKNSRAIEQLTQKIIDNNITYLGEMKSQKNPVELRYIKECFLKTDIVMSRVISWVNQSLEAGQKVSEKDLYDKVKDLFYQEGAVSLSFNPITASGNNTAFVHYTNPDKTKYIQNGELVLIDCGAYFEGGYATDITRTFIAGGTKASADSRQKEVYTKVLKAFLNGLYIDLKEDTTGFDIDKKVRDILLAESMEGFNFSHGTGHGIGIPVHESPPRISPSEHAKTPLKAGMCFTIEPGLYNDNWGGVRIENTVCITEEEGKKKIKTLVRSDFDENLINYDLLTEEEKSWLADYRKSKIH